MDNSPIYIAGPNRSGTSLLYALLASHPNISMVQRTDMWRYFYGQYGDLKQKDNFERCLKAMLQYRRITRLNPDDARIRREFWAGKPSYGRLFALFNQHYAESVGRTRWGDKSLHTEQHLDQIFSEFPGAKVLLVVRDPRDRYASERKKYRASAGSATGKWLESVQAIKYGLMQYPDGCHVVRYEALASFPEETLRQVCDFIQEDYYPVMLTMKGAPEHLEQGGDSSFGDIEPGVISTRSIGRFPKVISKDEIAFIQQFASYLMDEFGYHTHPVGFKWLDWLRFYLVVFPLNLARMVRTRLINKVNTQRGRSIPSHRIVKTTSLNLLEEH